MWTGRMGGRGSKGTVPLISPSPHSPCLLLFLLSLPVRTCSGRQGPDRKGAGEVIAEVLLATHTGVGDDREARALPMLDKTGLMIILLRTVLDDH